MCTAWLDAQPSPCLLSRGGTQESSLGLSLTAVQEGKVFVQSKLTNSPEALVPNSNVAGLIPLPHPAGRSPCAVG